MDNFEERPSAPSLNIYPIIEHGQPGGSRLINSVFPGTNSGLCPWLSGRSKRAAAGKERTESRDLRGKRSERGTKLRKQRARQESRPRKKPAGIIQLYDRLKNFERGPGWRKKFISRVRYRSSTSGIGLMARERNDGMIPAPRVSSSARAARNERGLDKSKPGQKENTRQRQSGASHAALYRASCGSVLPPRR